MRTSPTFWIEGQRWKILKQTPSRIILVPVGPDLVGWRAKNKLTQRAAAKKLGISQTHVAKIESGSRFCPAEVMERIREISSAGV